MFYKDKKILITGGTGFIGTNFVQALLSQGAKIRIPVHKRKPIISHRNIETIPADLNKQEDSLRACEGINCVIHAAGSVGSSVIGVNKMMASITENLTLTALMLQSAWYKGVERFLLFGSSTAYPIADYPIKEEELWNNPPYSGYFGYGWMRRYLERLGEFVHQQSDMKIALARPTAVYGSYDNFDLASCHVIPALINRSLKKENPFIVWGTGKEVRDFLHISDFVTGCLLLLEKHAECDPVNIGYGEGVSIKELVSIILRLTDHKDVSVEYKSPISFSAIPFRIVDTDKSKKLLGFKPAITLEKGILNTIYWYVDSQNNKS